MTRSIPAVFRSRSSRAFTGEVYASRWYLVSMAKKDFNEVRTISSSSTILLVDDEEMVLTSLKSFFAIDTKYHLLAYTSPVKALEDLERNTAGIDLVISDY